MEKPNKTDALDRALTDLHRLQDVPEGYRAGWRDAVKREERLTMTTPRKRSPFLRVALPLATALVLVIGAISAGNLIPPVLTPTSETAQTADYDASYGARSALGYVAAYDADMAAAPSGGTSSAKSVMYAAAENNVAGTATDEGQSTESGVKIVRTADLTIASTAFDEDTLALTHLTQELGGYVASVSLSGEASERKDRAAYYSLRIPSDQLSAFLDGLGSIGRITQRSETTTDMTTQYSDTSMRLSTQQAKMTRLKELLVKAADVSDLLEIENEIADTQYQIDSLESSLRTIDRDADNSQVSVSVYEQSAGDVAQVTELTLWQRLQSGFTASLQAIARFLQNLVVFLAMAAPVLVPLAVFALAVWLWRRSHRRPHGKSEPMDGDDSSAGPQEPTA